MKLEGGKYYWLRVKAEPDSTPEIGHCSCWVNSQGEQVVYFWLIAGSRDVPVRELDILAEVEPYEELNKEWPETWPKFYNYNETTGTPCDMVIGQCCCGATHQKGEFEMKNMGEGVWRLYRFGELCQ